MIKYIFSGGDAVSKRYAARETILDDKIKRLEDRAQAVAHRIDLKWADMQYYGNKSYHLDSIRGLQELVNKLKGEIQGLNQTRLDKCESVIFYQDQVLMVKNNDKLKFIQIYKIYENLEAELISELEFNKEEFNVILGLMTN